MTSTEDGNPRHVAMVLAMIGAGLVLLGVGLVLLCDGNPADGPPPSLAEASAVLALRNVLFLLIVLVGIFVVASFAFLRWSKHYRAWLLRRRVRPTPADDVWAMHRLPEDEDSGPEESAGGTPEQ